MEEGRDTCSFPGCQKPCYYDMELGVLQSYCSKSHAAEALSRVLLESLNTSGDTRHRCQLAGCEKAVYYDKKTGKEHDFCGRSHAQMAIALGDWPPRRSRGSSEHRSLGGESYKEFHYRDFENGQAFEDYGRKQSLERQATVARECAHPQCDRAAWVDGDTGAVLLYCGSRCARRDDMTDLLGEAECSLPGCVKKSFLHHVTGEDLGYCCEDHRLRATERCLGPNPEPFVDRTFRGGTTSSTDFQLSVLTRSHPSYASLRQQFLSKWKKPSTLLSVERIFKLQVPADVRNRYESYAASVANIRRRFHGTSCSDHCNFFVDLRGGPCGELSCSVCNICTHGFKLQGHMGRTAQLTNFNLRYGEGLYFSSVSGKANDYAAASEKDGPRNKKWRCMFTASVSVGRPYITQEGSLAKEFCPPVGYDSVLGEVGSELNYDEVVVYHEEAALPTFLIVYSML